MTTSQTNFNAIRNTYALVFEALERAMQKFDVDFYMIGAQSRDVWTNHLDIEKRITRDIDFAIFITREGWNKLNTYLIEIENFVRDLKLPYRFALSGYTIDLLPFGEIEENGEVKLDDPKMELSVYGCREVAAEAVIMDDKYKVITLPGLCIMKLVAYSENAGLRAKDWEDVQLILSNYSEIAGEQLFEGEYDDLLEGDFDLEIAAARMLGRHMKPILLKNEKLKDKITDLLGNKLMGLSFEDINQMYRVRENKDELVEKLKMIVELIRGIED